MDKVQKFLARLDRKLRGRVEQILSKLSAGDIRSLDVKPLEGMKGLYRCRFGQIRIIFAKTDVGIIIVDISFRGGMYRKR